MNEQRADNTNTSEAERRPPKETHTPAKKTKLAKEATQAKKPAAKPKANGRNTEAEVIAMMKHAKGATLAEIVKATGWQPTL